MPNAPMRPTKVACGTCRACCYQAVALLPEDGNDWKLDPEAPLPMLQRRPDGACVYLDPLLGCTVYERRPTVCREFHCGYWYAGLSAGERASIALMGDRHDREMLDSGRKHQPR